MPVFSDITTAQLVCWAVAKEEKHAQNSTQSRKHCLFMTYEDLICNDKYTNKRLFLQKHIQRSEAIAKMLSLGGCEAVIPNIIGNLPFRHSFFWLSFENKAYIKKSVYFCRNSPT
jgi:hypothetical protein